MATPDAYVPEVVAGRLRLSGGVLEGAIPSREEHRRVVYQFAKGESRPAISQPLTDTIRWGVALEAGDGNYLTLDLVPLRGDSSRGTRTLMLSQLGRPCRVAISNLPVHDPQAHDQHAMNDEAFAALHFGAYYELLKVKPAVRPLPLLWMTRPRPATGVMGPLLCPPALFGRD